MGVALLHGALVLDGRQTRLDIRGMEQQFFIGQHRPLTPSLPLLAVRLEMSL
jgi:hypothetical protein